MCLPHTSAARRVLKDHFSDLGEMVFWTRPDFSARMLSIARMVVRGILAVVLFAIACVALVAISLVAMYCDWRIQAVES